MLSRRTSPWWRFSGDRERGVDSDHSGGGGDLAARADFDLDAIDDLRMAVDEACAAVVGLAAPQAQLRCVFTIRPDRIQVIVETDVLAGQPTLATDSFGWRVLETLADGVSAHHVAGTDGQPDRIAVRLDKDAVPGVR